MALPRAGEILSEVDLASCDELLFVIKCSGTIVAAVVAAQSSVSDRSCFVLYTSLKQTFAFPLGPAVVFTGTEDPWVKSGLIPHLCREKGIPCHLISHANHSLETGDVQEDIEKLETRQFFR